MKELSYFFRKYWLLALMSLIGSILGVKLLLFVPAGAIYLVMTVVTLYYVIFSISMTS
ncbi:hypothetical protein GCM10007161_06400 [Ignatzschineria indica]|nr:hypothetical protein GCM10007161_06400 [Ignatzschineria indica]